MVDFKSFFLGLSQSERSEFSDAAKMSVQYIMIHLINKRKIPTKRTMIGLADAAKMLSAKKEKFAISYEDLVRFFYLDQRNTREVVDQQ